MKKLIAIILAVVLLCTPVFVCAIQENSSESIIVSITTEYLSDGSYIEIVLTQDITDVQTYGASQTISGNKSMTHKNSNGEVLWKFTLKGTFIYNPGSYANCVDSSYTTSNIASGWSLDSASTRESSNKAIADFVFIHKILFVTTDEIAESLTLTCSADGKLS